jgi:hypothetical protein
MGYRGLLLNDPYKIDRMVGECLIYFVCRSPNSRNKKIGLKELKDILW